jgi:hypothetical protein
MEEMFAIAGVIPVGEDTGMVKLFTRKRLEVLREKHANAVRKGKDSFRYWGTILDTRYAGYLIEYLDNRFAEFN